MKDKKSIERIFQERFKDFEVSAPEDAWENISERLHPKKKKRRVLPFWIKTSGIAASLALGFFLFITNSDSNNIELTQQENIKHKNQNKEQNRLEPVQDPVYENQTLTQNQSKNNQNNISPIQNTIVETEDNLVVQSQQNNQPTNHSRTQKQTQTQQTTQEFVENKQETQQLATNQNTNNNKQLLNNQNTQSRFSEIDSFETNNTVANTKEKSKNNQFLSSSPKEKTTLSSEENTDENSIVNQEKQPEVNELVELLAQIEEGNQEKEKENNPEYSKWRITPNVAPITMNSLSEGSPVSEQFSSNTKDYQTSVSVGLGFNYALTEKINIRTGINKFLVGYNTNDVAIYASADAKDILSNNVNINFSQSANNIVLKPEAQFSVQNQGVNQHLGYINQKIGFIEVPMELSYKILNKKLNIEIIGGMSTLFLQENEISVISDGMSTNLGEANNLSDVHFSTNFGMGFRYEFLKSFEASLEPMFKYQIGTFTKNDGNFKPYILGLYTGLSFKF